jgi:H+-transporting ATPase
MPGFDDGHVLGLAALASSDGGQDSVDAAIRLAASHKAAPGLPKLTHFVPFDPARKISEATATDANGAEQHILKGAFSAVSALTTAAPDAATMADELEKQGFRVLAVAAGPQSSIQIVGFIALSDPPREDSVWTERYVLQGGFLNPLGRKTSLCSQAFSRRASTTS